MSRRNYVWTAPGAGGDPVRGLNIFVDNFFTDTRLDLTQTGQYTLSQGTRNIIAKLPEPVTLRFYFSRKEFAPIIPPPPPMPSGCAICSANMLRSAMARSSWRMSIPNPSRLKKTKPMPPASAPAPTDSGDVVYFGLEGVNSIDGKRDPFPISRSSASPIWNMTSHHCSISCPSGKAQAGDPGLPAPDRQSGGHGPGQPLTIYAQLRQNYDVTTLAADFTAIPAGTNLLLMAHPENVTLGQQRAIAVLPAAWRQGADLRRSDVRTGARRGTANRQTRRYPPIFPLLKGLGRGLFA